MERVASDHTHQTLYDSLTPTARLSIDASAGGTIMNKKYI